MRTMHLPAIPMTAQSREECIELYFQCLSTNEAFRPDVSVLLTAYLAWPNDEERRNAFVATSLARLSRPSGEVTANSAGNLRREYPLKRLADLTQ